MRKAQKNSDNMTFREQLKERYKQQGFLAEYYKEYPDSFWDNLERFSEGHYFIEDEIKAIPDDSIWDKDGSHTPTMGIIEYIKKNESINNEKEQLCLCVKNLLTLKRKKHLINFGMK